MKCCEVEVEAAESVPLEAKPRPIGGWRLPVAQADLHSFSIPVPHRAFHISVYSISCCSFLKTTLNITSGIDS